MGVRGGNRIRDEDMDFVGSEEVGGAGVSGVGWEGGL